MEIKEEQLVKLKRKHEQLIDAKEYTEETEEQCILLGFEIALRILEVKL